MAPAAAELIVVAAHDVDEREAAELLAAGQVLAIKGLGGYHLAVDAACAPAAETLRARKHREDKPFAVLAADLAAAAEALALGFELVSGAQWQLRGVRSDGAAFTIDSFGRYMVHEPVHHLFDVTTDLPADRP